MSRIAGFFSKNELTQPDRIINSMLRASQSNIEWQASAAHLGRVWAGVCSWRSVDAFRNEQLLIVIDGFIYNQTNLGMPQSFNAAQVVGALYVKHGFSKTLSLLNGDFAIALYDFKLNEMWLGRDRFGVKPLYYCDKSDYLAFASRPAGLFVLPHFELTLNQTFVGLFAAGHYRYIDNNREQSPYVGINQLPAAHTLHLKNGNCSISPYWSLEELPEFREPEAELAQKYRELLLDAVRIRLNKVRRPAFTLSGGMDSSAILASAARILGAKQHAYSVVHQDKTYNESEEIQSMLEGNVQTWNPIAVDTPDLYDLVNDMISQHDEPVATATWLSHFLLCKEVNRVEHDALFGGLGGDELNAGEYEYFYFYFADLRNQGKEDLLDKETEKWVAYHNHPVFRKSKGSRDEALKRLVSFDTQGQCFPDRVRLDRYAHTIDSKYFNIKEFTPAMDHPFKSYLKNRTFQDLFRETSPCCLRAEDRQSTAFGLDHFAPFFDHRLVEFMFRVPGHMKIRMGVTKFLLREAMRGILPEETRTRVKKMGWNAPAHLWFSGHGQKCLLDLVSSRSFRERGIYKPEEVLRIIKEHNQIVCTGKNEENHMMFLWQVLNLEIWLSKLDSNSLGEAQQMECQQPVQLIKAEE